MYHSNLINYKACGAAWVARSDETGILRLSGEGGSSTVGMGASLELSTLGKSILILLMLAGRNGILILNYFIAKRLFSKDKAPYYQSL